MAGEEKNQETVALGMLKEELVGGTSGKHFLDLTRIWAREPGTERNEADVEGEMQQNEQKVLSSAALNT